ncbi:MAG: hypothetical protein JW857_11335 [Bacteroidales bacterium]|nr:hypothetical protein [Bacteroidales bacterium]
MKVRKNKQVKHFLFIFLFSLGIPLLQAHPFYVSICEIDYKDHALEISLRLFTTDLEKTMEDWGAGKLHLGEKNEIANADSLLKDYVFQSISLKVDGKKPILQFIGKEVNQELTWIYIEADDVPDFNTINISNRVLFQIFPGQTNLIHVNHREKTKSLLLTKNNPSGELDWN